MAEHVAEGRIAADHPCLAGHFPGRPVVPAVVLLEFTLRAVAGALGRRVRLAAVPAVKFTNPLLPEQAFHVKLQVDEAARIARFSVATAQHELAQGRLEYADD